MRHAGKLLALLVGIGSTSMEELAFLKRELNNVFMNIEFLIYTDILSPPVSAYNWSRAQYLSEGILELLRDVKSKLGVDMVLGIAGLDAYSPGLNFVFGEAVLGEGVSTVYTKRLRHGLTTRNTHKYYERLLKESLHEIGHSLGLAHCSHRGCVMNFSNSIREVDAKTARYCLNCAEKLREKGVLVNSSFILKPVDH